MLPLILAAVLAAASPPQDTVRLTLADAATRALAGYPSVALARSTQERALADMGEANAARRPSLLLEGGLTRFQEPMLVYPFHGFPSAGPGGALAGPSPVFDRTLAQGSAFVQWTLFDFGARSSRSRAASSLGDAATGALSAAEQDLMALVAAGYLATLTAREMVAARDQRIVSLEAEAARTRQLLEEGKTARIEVLRIDAELARARAERIGVVARLDVAERDLARLTSLTIESVRAARLTSPRVSPRTAGDTARSQLVERALSANPDVAAARDRALAARSAHRAASATRLPELRLSTGYVDRGHGSGDFRAEWQAGLAVTYPLYTGGARASAIRRAAADESAARQRQRLAELAVEQAVDRALAAVREARARVDALRTAVERSEEVVRIESVALEAGSRTRTDYLSAEAQLLAVRADLIEARHAHIAAHVDLARATGTLTPAWLASHLEGTAR